MEPDTYIDATFNPFVDAIKVRLPSGIIQEVNKYEEWILYRDITIQGEYKAAVDYLLSLKRPVSFLDLGANVGFTSFYIADKLLQAKQEFKALLVEPNPDTFHELCNRVNRNSWTLSPSLLIPICGLVGKSKGKAFFRTDGCHTISKAFSKIEKGGGTYYETPYMHLDDYLDDEPIDLIKCDIEGCEYDFVESHEKLLSRVGAIIMEIHSDSGDAKKLRHKLSKYGLSICEQVKVDGLVSTEMFSRK